MPPGDIIDCLDENQLQQVLHGAFAEADRDVIEAHLDQCEDCRMLFVAMVQASFEEGALEKAADIPEPSLSPPLSPAPWGTTTTLLPKGCQFGRYRIEGPLGAGGMGVVYLARDAELDRQIALKLVRNQDALGHQARLQREAKMMAKLSHPSIVTVYELGFFASQAYIAMEYVEGQTLTATMREQKLSAAQRWTLLAQAGEALSYAHKQGVIHRDFKPENVLVTRAHQRAKVTDFGLARLAALSEESDPERQAPGRMTIHTQTGARVGTPAYMAPEQMRGEQATPKSDQFSFCVTLWEALAGIHPFVGKGDDIAARLTHMEHPVGGFQGAAWLTAPVRRCLERGMAATPAQRFEDMDALLEALDKAQARFRFGPLLWLPAAAVVAAFFVLVGPWRQETPRPQPAKRVAKRRAPIALRRPSVRPAPTSAPVRRRRVVRRRKPPAGAADALALSQLDFQIKEALDKGQLLGARRLFYKLRMLYQAKKAIWTSGHSSHLLFTKALHNQGMVELWMNNHWRAKRFFQKSLSRQRSLFGAAHPAMALTFAGVALVHAKAHRYKMAQTWSQKAHSAALRSFGRSHRVMLQMHHMSSYLALERGQLTDALTGLERLYQSFVKRKAPLEAAITAHNMGVVLTKANRQGQASAAFRKAQKALAKVLPSGHFMRGVCDYNLGRWIALFQMTPKARTLLVRSSRVLYATMGMTRTYSRKAAGLLNLRELPARPKAMMRIAQWSRPLPLPRQKQLRQRIKPHWLHQRLLLR